MQINPATWQTRKMAISISMALALSCAGCESESPQQPPAMVFGKPITQQEPVKLTPDEVRTLLQKRRCHVCHAKSRQLMGPSYEEIGLAYSAREDITAEVLAQKIIEGGGGNWGVVPMVPNEHVTRDEALAMANWILELTP